MTHISSRPALTYKGGKDMEFFVDVDGTEKDEKICKAVDALEKVAVEVKVNFDVPNVPWFPRKLNDLDTIGKTTTLKEGEGIAYTDHPGFRDPDYVKRRDYISSAAMDYKMSDPEVPRIKYTDVENGVWNTGFKMLREKWHDVACKEYNEALDAMMDAGVLRYEEIPQLEDVSQYL